MLVLPNLLSDVASQATDAKLARFEQLRAGHLSDFDFSDDDREEHLAILLESIKARRQLFGLETNISRPNFSCPPPGTGVYNWSEEVEDYHWARHNYWATEMDFCRTNGLWTGGCDWMCPLRAAIIGDFVGLRPGQLVLDVGAACGHFAEWFYEW